MARRHHYKRRTKLTAHELDVTTFLNLMVVLVPFLLITGRVLAADDRGAQPAEHGRRAVECGRGIPCRSDRSARTLIEITNGKNVIAAIPNVEGEYDLDTLSDFMVELKNEYPAQESASVLMEAMIPYDYLIQVMDIVRAVEIPIEDARDNEPQFELVALFSEISVGDAP
jgi:biopolymer transport protein ExbD